MKNLRIQTGGFINEDLLTDITNGNKRFSLKREIIKHAYMPIVAALGSAYLATSVGESFSPAKNVVLTATSIVGVAMLEAYVIYNKKADHNVQTRKAAFNLQNLCDVLKTHNIHTSIPKLLESCMLLTDVVSYRASYTNEDVVEEKEIIHIEDFVFYDQASQLQVLRQTNQIVKDGFKKKVTERRLYLLEPTDEEYTKATSRTRTKLIAR